MTTHVFLQKFNLGVLVSTCITLKMLFTTVWRLWILFIWSWILILIIILFLHVLQDRWNRLPERMQRCTGCICLIFLHCVFSNVSSNHLHEMRHNHIGCICLTFPQCAFSNVSSNRLPGRMHNHIGCIFRTFLHCVFSNVSSKRLPEKQQLTIREEA